MKAAHDTLTSARLAVRRYTADDLDLLVRLHTDPEVTRFTGDSPNLLGTGPIAVRAALGEAPGGWEYAAFQTAVAEELARIGYIVTGDDAAQVAEIRVERFVEPGADRRSPVTVGVGGMTKVFPLR